MVVLLTVCCRYEDSESQPGCPLAVGVVLQRLSAHTTDEQGNEAFVTERVLALLRKVGYSFPLCIISVLWGIGASVQPRAAKCCYN